MSLYDIPPRGQGFSPKLETRKWVKFGKWHRTMYERITFCGVKISGTYISMDGTGWVQPEYRCKRCEKLHAQFGE